MNGTGNVQVTEPVSTDQAPASRFAATKPLLIGVDSSEGSHHALAWSAIMARSLGEEAEAFHAFSPWAGLEMSIPPFDYDQFRDAVENAMTDWTAPLDGVEHRNRVVEDDPADGLVGEASKIDAGIIVVGTHAHGDRFPRMLGSVASKLLHISPTPVAVVPQSARLEPPAGRIVVGLDGSASSMRALRWSATWASALGLGVYAICAFPMEAYSEKPRLADIESVDPIGDTLGALRELAHQVAVEEHIETTSDVVVGHAAEKLIAASRDEFALVVGKTGHSTFTEVVFGSTSHKCATHSVVPAVVVP